MLREFGKDHLYQMPEESMRQLNAILVRVGEEKARIMRERIHEWANALTDERQSFFASNWKIAGTWIGTPFQPLYEVCEELRSEDAEQEAGFQVGWLQRQVLCDEFPNDEFVFFKYHGREWEEAPRELRGTFYWRATREQQVASASA